MCATRNLCMMLVAAGLATLLVTNARAQSTPPAPNGPPTSFDAVEEDWELVVATPDVTGVGPQITTCMSPVAGNPSPFFVAFNLNYRERPNFAPGGMHVKVWANSEILSTSSAGSAQFGTPGETVTWTQRMFLLGGLVVYDVKDGHSITWGAFGQGWLLGAVFPSTVSTLAGYDPEASVRTSGVGWQSNNVTHLILMRVRYYSDGQLIWTDTNPRPVVAND
jgi:hypothetical protein